MGEFFRMRSRVQGSKVQRFFFGEAWWNKWVSAELSIELFRHFAYESTCCAINLFFQPKVATKVQGWRINGWDLHWTSNLSYVTPQGQRHFFDQTGNFGGQRRRWTLNLWTRERLRFFIETQGQLAYVLSLEKRILVFFD